ncbi:WecB/TagA/CpsF family glycosyltransferase [Kitasatospora sp. MAP5-34]|uniref:WecB/TagA/CpsF family glycosyltransferase n=1 Tax=Kitasatospora sp. MAP5-34 TaxID=3035102 RepID=UPI0024738766|nr:WecB/TagA/CpsF family glycosyltransferase [Kitasatospora sp. MAP5-34]MDH6576162.1 N-acetylglucosaminyldiphosphoundecaprenol N-acetyl-beta-D-mannosaminyltransferase [Kitasatospora sp. MAP5-34]
MTGSYGAGRAGEARRLVLGGTPADGWDLAGLLLRVKDRLTGPLARPLVVASSNLDHLHHFGRGGAHAGLVERAEQDADWLVLLDGMPLVWQARRLTGSRWERLTGADLLPDLLAVAASTGARVGFLGGQQETHRLLAVRLAEEWPELAVAGYWAPSRAELTAPGGAAALAEQVRLAAVDLLVVGLGKPRQEAWLAEQAVASGIRVGLAVGAAADFLAGVVDRAPDRWRDSGLEWLYRLVLEPRRLARRYLLQGPRAALRLLLNSRA